jgi:hypothetical protein
MWDRLSRWEKLKWHLADFRDDFGALAVVLFQAFVAGVILFAAAAASGVIAGLFRLVRNFAIG